MIIKIEDIKRHLETRRRWNHTPLDRIQFYENGQPLKIDPEIVRAFMDTGLNNIDFISSGYYKRKDISHD